MYHKFKKKKTHVKDLSANFYYDRTYISHILDYHNQQFRNLFNSKCSWFAFVSQTEVTEHLTLQKKM